MRRDAVVPIDDELTTMIEAQQARARQQFPTTGVLLPRGSANPDGRLPIPTATFHHQLGIWIETCGITDELGRPVRVTAHQFRHSYATRLNMRGIASDASFDSRGERCGSDDLGLRPVRRRRSGCHLTRLVSCVDARPPTARMHWVQR
jgi:integrase